MNKKYHNNQQLYKQHELTLDISATKQRPVVTNTQFFTRDIQTGKKIINFTLDGVPVNLTDKKIILGFEFVKEEASRVITSTEDEIQIENARLGRISINLPHHMYQYSGEVLIHAYIIFDDGRSLDAGVIITEFEESWLDRELPEMEKFYVKRFEALEREVRARVDDIQNLFDELRQEAEALQEQLPDLQTELNNRAPLSHHHTISEVTGLQAHIDDNRRHTTRLVDNAFHFDDPGNGYPFGLSMFATTNTAAGFPGTQAIVETRHINSIGIFQLIMSRRNVAEPQLLWRNWRSDRVSNNGWSELQQGLSASAMSIGFEISEITEFLHSTMSVVEKEAFEKFVQERRKEKGVE